MSLPDVQNKSENFKRAIQGYINSSCKNGKIEGDTGIKIRAFLEKGGHNLEPNNYCQSLEGLFTEEFIDKHKDDLAKISGINEDMIENILTNMKASITNGMSWSDTIKNAASYYYKKIGYLDKAAFSIVLVMLLKYYFNVSSPIIGDWLFNVGATAAATFSYFGGKKDKRDKAKAGKKIKKYETSNIHEILSGINKKVADWASVIYVEFDKDILEEEIDPLEYKYGINYYSIAKREKSDKNWKVSKYRFDKAKSFLACSSSSSPDISGKKTNSIECSDFRTNTITKPGESINYEDNIVLNEDVRDIKNKIFRNAPENFHSYLYEYLSSFYGKNPNLQDYFKIDENIVYLDSEIKKLRETFIYYLLILYKKIKKSTRLNKKGLETFVYELANKKYFKNFQLTSMDVNEFYYTKEDLEFNDELIGDIYDFIAGKKEQRGKLNQIPTIYCCIKGPFSGHNSNTEINVPLFPVQTLSAVACINPTFPLPVCYKIDIDTLVGFDSKPYLYKQLIKQLNTDKS